MAHPPSHASCRSPHCPCPLPQRCAAGSPAPAAAARGKEAAVRRRHRIVPPSFIPSTAGLRYYPQLSHKMHFKLCVVLFVVAVALVSVRSVLPAWLPCQNQHVLPADLHAIPFARNTQQVQTPCVCRTCRQRALSAAVTPAEASPLPPSLSPSPFHLMAQASPELD